MTIDELKDRIAERVKRIADLAPQIPDDLPVGSLLWLRHHFLDPERYQGLRYDDEPPGKVNGIQRNLEWQYGTQKRSPRLLLGDAMLSAMTDLINTLDLRKQRIAQFIDNFVLHELFHHAQRMEYGEHRNLREIASNVLHELDCEADAHAVWAMMTLDALETLLSGSDALSKFEDYWTRFPRFIDGAILQIYLFNWMTALGIQPPPKADADISDLVSVHSVNIQRLQRIGLWHYQFHRAERFNKKHPLADLRLFSTPTMGFRNQIRASAQGVLNGKWPATEREWFLKNTTNNAGLNQFALTQCDYLGVRGLARISAPADDIYDELFEGLFRADTDRSEAFFANLFLHHPWLICKEGDHPPILPPGDPGHYGPGPGPNFPTPYHRRLVTGVYHVSPSRKDKETRVDVSLAVEDDDTGYQLALLYSHCRPSWDVAAPMFLTEHQALVEEMAEDALTVTVGDEEASGAMADYFREARSFDFDEDGD